jgi:hypothetical protein
MKLAEKNSFLPAEQTKKETNFRMNKKDIGYNSANITETKGGGKGKSFKKNEPEPDYPFTKEEV